MSKSIKEFISELSLDQLYHASEAVAFAIEQKQKDKLVKLWYFGGEGYIEKYFLSFVDCKNEFSAYLLQGRIEERYTLNYIQVRESEVSEYLDSN